MGTSRILLVATAVAASAFAQAPTPKHPFSAEYVYTANGQPMAGMPTIKVAATAKAVLVDFGPHGAIIELRPDAARVTTVMHDAKTYATSSMPYDSEDLGDYFFMVAPSAGYAAECDEEGLSCEMVGVEEVAGRPAEHWRVEDPAEGTFDSWVDADLGIIVKSSSADGYGLEARNLSTATPAASLFTVPEGYSKAGGEEW
jgi:hypothetical protein